MSDLPIDDLLVPDVSPAHESDPTQALEATGAEAVGRPEDDPSPAGG